MGLSSTSKENQVLKLVHPGGIVELHFNPVSASEIMNKNPRHWVTRPDFFKFPWIVVSPQAILTPGNVFFIVPSHTIRHLLKNKNESSSDQPCHSHNRARKISHSNNKTQYSFKQRTKTPHKHRNRGAEKTHAFVPVSSGEYTSRGDARKVSAWSHDSEEKIPKLKPCLKKKDNKNHNSAARSRDLRVRFDEVNTIKTCEF